MFCGFLGVFFLSFRSCFRIFSVASVRTVFYTVIFPPPARIFVFSSVSRGRFLFFLRFPFRIVFLPAIFSKFPVFYGFFPRRAAVSSAAYFLLCAAFLSSSAVSFSYRFFSLPPHSALSLNRLLHRNFSAAPPEVPFFSISRGRFLFFLRFPFRIVFHPAIFSKFPVFHGFFRRAAVPSAAYFLLCAAFLPSSVVSFSTVFSLTRIRLYL